MHSQGLKCPTECLLQLATAKSPFIAG